MFRLCRTHTPPAWNPLEGTECETVGPDPGPSSDSDGCRRDITQGVWEAPPRLEDTGVGRMARLSRGTQRCSFWARAPGCHKAYRWLRPVRSQLLGSTLNHWCAGHCAESLGSLPASCPPTHHRAPERTVCSPRLPRLAWGFAVCSFLATVLEELCSLIPGACALRNMGGLRDRVERSCNYRSPPAQFQSCLPPAAWPLCASVFPPVKWGHRSHLLHRVVGKVKNYYEYES